MKVKPTITRIHIYLLAVIFLNVIFKLFTDFSLNYSVAFAIKIILYLTGIILFFLNLKPFKKISLYFSIFVLTALMPALFWIFHGIFLGLVSSILLFPISPKTVQYEKENFKIYPKFQGFMGACCAYEITEQKFFIFERYLGEFRYEGIDVKTIDLKVENDSITMKLQEINYDYEKEIKHDTIIKVKIE